MNIVKELSAKVSELERKIGTNSNSAFLQVFENKSLIGKFVQGTVSHSLGTITAEVGGQTVLQGLVKINADVVNSVNIKLFAGNMLLYDSDRVLSVGDNEIFLMASLMLVEGESVEVVLEVSPSEVLSNYLSTATLYLWSNSFSAKTNDKSVINADLSDGLMCVSLMVDKKIYNFSAEDVSSLDFSKFFYYADGLLSDCVILGTESPTCCWFRLASDNTLYMSKSGNVQDERVVAKGVSVFSVSAFGERSGILVCFIRDNLPYYMTIEGESLSSEMAFEVNKGKKYKSICALKSNSHFIYVVISTDSGTNLLFDVAPELGLGSRVGDCIQIETKMVYG
ncbi:MAG: hypothetical protein J6J23_01945 [Clostridia bacterium]|nr:hypothetical protein [Clostridia bacterium]